MDAPIHEELSWIERLKNSFQFDRILERLNINQYTLINIALFLAVGFLIGFLWKKYTHYVIAGFFFIITLVILQQLNFILIDINWFKIQECCGIVPALDHADIFKSIISWAKMNLIIILSFLIGFSFGAKIS